MTELSTIHDIVLPTMKTMRRGSSNEVTYTLGNIPRATNTDPTLTTTVEWLLNNVADFKSVQELTRNQTFSSVYLSGLPRKDGIYTIMNRDLSEIEWEPDRFPVSLSLQRAPMGKWQYNWSTEKLETDWDTYIDADWTAAGAQVSAVSITDEDSRVWTVGNGTWGCDTGGGGSAGKFYLDVGVTRDQLVTGNLWWSDVDVQVEVTHTAATNSIYSLLVRMIATVTHGTGYGFSFNPSSEIMDFVRLDGATASTLREWSFADYGLSAASGVVNTLRVLALGDKFWLWVNGVSLTSEDDPVIDNTYPEGKVGVKAYDDHTEFEFDNFVCNIGKPSHVPIPPGDYELSRYYDDRQITSRGLNKLLVSPKQPVTFDERWLSDNQRGQCILDLQFSDGDSISGIDFGGYKTTLSATAGYAELVTDGYNSYQPNSLKMTGGTGRIYTSDSHINIGQFTIEAFVKIHTDFSSGTDVVVYAYDSGVANYSFYLALINDGSGIYVQTRARTPAGINLANSSEYLAVGEWYHLIGTFDGTTIYNYIDGVQDGSAAIAGRLIPTTTLYVGASSTGGSPLDNTVLNSVRILSYPMTATEVSQRHDQLNLNFVGNNEVYVWGVPTNTMGDGHWDDLVLWARCNEGEYLTLNDSSKNAFTGTVLSTPFGTTRWVDSVHPSFGKALDLEASDSSYVDFGDESAFSFAGDVPFSIGCWFKSENFSGWQTLIAKYNDNGVNEREWLFRTNAGKLWFHMLEFDNGAAYISAGYDSALSTGIWYYVIFTYDGSETFAGTNIYLNGVSVKDTGTLAGGYSGMSNTASHLTIGAVENPSQYWDGVVDEFTVWKREVTATEALWYYNNAPNIYDESLWQRVRSIDHPFEDQRMVVENGQVRWWEDRHKVSDTSHHQMEVWNGCWDYAVDYLLYPAGHTAPVEAITLKTITPYLVEWEADMPNGDAPMHAVQMRAMRAGIPVVWSDMQWFDGLHDTTEGCYGVYVVEHKGSGYPAGRFVTSLEETQSDYIVDTFFGDTHNLALDLDCFSISFSPDRNFLQVFVYTGSDYDTDLMYIRKTAAATYAACATKANDVDETLRMAFGLIPFDTSWLHFDFNKHHSTTGWWPSDVTTSTGRRCQLDAGEWIKFFQLSNSDYDVQPGAYRLTLRVKESAADAQVQFGLFDGAAAWNYDLIADLTTDYLWYYTDVIITDTHISDGWWIYLLASGAQDVYVDESVLVPISLHNFQGPLNIAHAALAPIDLQRIGI